MKDLALTALTGVLVPAVATALVLALGLRRIGAEGDSPARRRLAVVVALGLGYLAGHAVLNGLPPWRFDVELKDGLFWVATAALVVGVVEAALGRPATFGRIGLAAATPWYLLDFMREHHWELGEGRAWTAGLAAALFLLLLALGGLARRAPAAGLATSWSVGLGAVAGAIALSGSATLGQLTGVAATSAIVLAAFAWRRGTERVGDGAATVVGVVLASVVLGGRFASELSPLGAVLCVLTPLAPWLAHAGPLARRSPRARFAAALVLTLAVGGAALALEHSLLPEPYDPYG